MTLPKHLAIIMDGNGRWAKSKGKPRSFGHIKGARVARAAIEFCARSNIQNLTLYTFSTENWLRPTDEISLLMRILQKYMIKERQKLNKENIKFSIIGDISRLPVAVAREVQKTVDSTKNNTGLHLTFALNYSGRQEIAKVMKNIAVKVDLGELRPEQIDESLIAAEILRISVPDADLIIRTSGEKRISNFLLWQSAYSEFYFSEKLWPDFEMSDLSEALVEFERRERRFGKTTEQVKATQV